MPSFDLRYIQCAPYQFSEGNVTYGAKQMIGDAMSVDINMTFAEGRLYAEGKLSEFIKEVTGGTISIAVKDILAEAQKIMFGVKDKQRTISDSPIQGLAYSAKDTASYVGVSCYCKDRVDNATKFTCLLVIKSLFGPPAMSKQTKGQNITFSTPTTTGEFLPSDADDQDYLEVAIVDDEAAAKQWCDSVLEDYGQSAMEASALSEQPIDPMDDATTPEVTSGD